MQVVGEVGLGFLLVHRGLVLRDVRLIIALGFRDLAVGGELGFLAGLRRLRGFDHGVAIGFGLRDLSIAFDLGNARFAERVEVPLRVANVANGEADNAQAHVGHVAGGHFLHLRGKGVAVLVNLLHRHRAEDGAQMAFKRLRGDVADFVGVLAQELFSRGSDRDVVPFDFDLRHAVHLHRHAFAGVNFRGLHVDGEQFEGKNVHFFHHGVNERAAAFDDAEAARFDRSVRVGIAMFFPGDNEHFVRANLRVTAEHNGDADDQRHRNQHDGDQNHASGKNRLGQQG